MDVIRYTCDTQNERVFMKTTCKIIRLYNEYVLQGHKPTKVYVDDRIYGNLCREHKIPDGETISEVYGLKVVFRAGGQNSIDFF